MSVCERQQTQKVKNTGILKQNNLLHQGKVNESLGIFQTIIYKILSS